jgi:tRNA-dihydrouridine synthase 2
MAAPSSIVLTNMSSVEEKASKIYAGVGLAPMVRASTTPLRVLALRYGADFVYTEEFIDRSLSSSVRIENKELGTIDYVKKTISKKSHKRLVGAPPLLLRIDPSLERGKLICQIGSGEPELALQAALHVHQDVDAIDLNMGCPMRFSVSGGMGSALLKDPDRACRIVRLLSEHMTPKGLPVSVKIRLLKDTASTVDLITALIQAGASAVAIHGRTVRDESHHPADWDTLKEVVQLAKEKHTTVPILVNGDFYTRNEFINFQQETGANGVLLARPALYNTSIFRKPTALAGDYGYHSPLLLDKTTVVQEYLRLSIRYQTHYQNVKYVVCEFMTNRRAPSPRVPFLTRHWPGGQTIAKVCNCHNLPDICKVWDVNATTTPVLVQEQQQGEHKYLDSYFLGQEPAAKEKNDTSLLPAKRPRADDASHVGVEEKTTPCGKQS